MTNQDIFRILIVDDNRAIHMDFKRILAASPTAELDRAAMELFGDAPLRNGGPAYDLSFVAQGIDAVDAVKTAVDSGNPFALAFVDMRMPPGLDGVETISRLWQADPHLFAVICTAYSDRTWEQIIHTLGHGEQLFIIKKPFENCEITQVAATLTRRWSEKRESDIALKQLLEQAESRAREVRSLHLATPAT